MNKEFLKKIGKYSICYLVIMLAVIMLFLTYNKSFVWVNVSYDGLDQHLVNLQLLKNFLLGNYNCFFWNVGYGIDLFANFVYYIFGDFPSYIAVLFKDNKLDVAYEIIIMLRVYLVGISFLVYTKNKKYSNDNAVIGTILYTFSTFLLFAMARHPYFLNSMIVFPILLLSVEKLLLENKKVFFIIMVSIMFISSFYFGYMLSLISMIYGFIILYKKKSNIKEIIKKGLIAVLYALVGIMIAGIVLIPTFEAFMNSPRIGGNLYYYSLIYYPNLFASLISTLDPGNWSIIGISSIILVTLPLFVLDKKRDNRLLNFLVVLFIPLTIPIIGTIIDCMSFPNNRWIFVIPFILSLITIEVLEKKHDINIKKSSLFILLYALIIFITRFKITFQEIIAIVFAFIFLYLIAKKRKYILIAVVGSILCNFYFMYDSKYGGYINEFVSRDATSLYKNNNNQTPYLDEAVNFIKDYDHGFYNILVYPNVLNNLGLMNDYNSSSYFYSIVSKNYYSLAQELENQEMQMNEEIKSFNERTKINELLNNKYLITTNKDYHPYGYEVIKSYDNKTFVLENKVSSSFAHLYTKSIKEEDYDKLSPLLKEDALLKYYMSEESDSINLSNIQSVPYQSSVSLDSKSITINDVNNDIILDFDSIHNSELYVSITNLHRVNGLEYMFDRNNYNVEVCLNDLCFLEWEDSKYLTAYHIDNTHVLINLGYYEELSGQVKITFNGNGTYSFDNIELLAVDFSDYENTVNNLNVDLTNMVKDDSTISFDANIREDGILSFTTNYSKYFDIYVDDNKVPTKVVNKYFLGCEITKGNHRIKIVYNNTLIKKSMYVSILGILVLLTIIIIDKRKCINKKTHK